MRKRRQIVILLASVTATVVVLKLLGYIGANNCHIQNYIFTDPNQSDQISSYEFSTKKEGKFYPMLQKNVNCKRLRNLLLSGTVEEEYKLPPKAPPAHLRDAFTLYGVCPVKKPWYCNEAHLTSSRKVWTRAQIDSLVNQSRAGRVISSYLQPQLARLLRAHRALIRDKHVFVLGSARPWLEAHLLVGGARHVSTMEYGNIEFQHPQLKVLGPKKIAQQGVLYDLAVSYSSVEHSGLGRYGDKLNPYGDLEAVAQVWCLLKPGGVFILGVPYSDPTLRSCDLPWNAHRHYGFPRLQHLTANFEQIKLIKDMYHVILMLKKPVL